MALNRGGGWSSKEEGPKLDQKQGGLNKGPF